GLVLHTEKWRGIAVRERQERGGEVSCTQFWRVWYRAYEFAPSGYHFVWNIASWETQRLLKISAYERLLKAKRERQHVNRRLAAPFVECQLFRELLVNGKSPEKERPDVIGLCQASTCFLIHLERCLAHRLQGRPTVGLRQQPCQEIPSTLGIDQVSTP